MKSNHNLGLLLLLVSILAWFGLVRAQVNSFSKLTKDVKAKSLELKSYETRVSDVNKIKEAGAVAQERLRSYFLAMPKLSQIPETLVMLEQLGSSSGVSFTSASLGTPANSEVPATVSFTGSLDSVTNFLEASLNNVRTISIKNQTLTAEANGNLTVSMQLGFIYQGE